MTAMQRAVPNFEARRQALGRQLREAATRGDREAVSIVRDALRTVEREMQEAAVALAAELEAAARKTVERTARRARAVTRALAMGRGTVAQVRAAEAAERDAKAALRKAEEVQRLCAAVYRARFANRTF